MSTPATDDGTAEAATCAHGMLVGLHDTTDPRECQACDFCSACQAVQVFDGETCTACGGEWGSA